MKLGEKESFIFQDGTKTYRCASEPEGYQCPMCPKVFSQLGRHINSSECGKNINIKKFTEELKKYLRMKKINKQKSENPTEYRQKEAQRKMTSRRQHARNSAISTQSWTLTNQFVFYK